MIDCDCGDCQLAREAIVENARLKEELAQRDYRIGDLTALVNRYRAELANYKRQCPFCGAEFKIYEESPCHGMP